MGLNAPSWLMANPVAHRGLHDARRGVIENTLGAAEEAAASGSAIECDVQASADGEAFVFHDDALDRLTLANGPFFQKTSSEIRTVRFKEGSGRIPTLVELLQRIAGRTRRQLHDQPRPPRARRRRPGTRARKRSLTPTLS